MNIKILTASVILALTNVSPIMAMDEENQDREPHIIQRPHLPRVLNQETDQTRNASFLRSDGELVFIARDLIVGEGLIEARGNLHIQAGRIDIRGGINHPFLRTHGSLFLITNGNLTIDGKIEASETIHIQGNPIQIASNDTQTIH